MTRRLAVTVALCVAFVLLAGSCGDEGGGKDGAEGANRAGPSTVSGPDVTAKAGGPQSAEEAARALYDAWRADDHVAAQDVSEMDAHRTLFATPGEGADWAFQGCDGAGADRVFDCAFTYEGGAAQMRVALTGLYGWRVLEVAFTAD